MYPLYGALTTPLMAPSALVAEPNRGLQSVEQSIEDLHDWVLSFILIPSAPSGTCLHIVGCILSGKEQEHLFVIVLIVLLFALFDGFPMTPPSPSWLWISKTCPRQCRSCLCWFGFSH